jgi:hypothetical protein
MRTTALVMIAAAAFAVCASAVGIPAAAAGPAAPECADSPDPVTCENQVHSDEAAACGPLRAQFAQLQAQWQRQLASGMPQPPALAGTMADIQHRISSTCSDGATPPQQVAGGNENQIPPDLMKPPGQAPITPVIPQGPPPKNPYSPAFPDA